MTRLCAIIALLAVRMCNCQRFSTLLFVYLFFSFIPVKPRAECGDEQRTVVQCDLGINIVWICIIFPLSLSQSYERKCKKIFELKGYVFLIRMENI